MAETKINASQTTITASDIGAARAATVLPTASADNVGDIVQFIGSSGSQIKFDVVDSDLTPDNPTVSVDVSKLSGLTLGDSGSLMVSYEVSENNEYIAVVDNGEDTIQSDGFGTPEEAYASVGIVFSATPAFAEVSYSAETYTNGYFYKCTESSGLYSWVQTDVQPAPSGLPDQTGQSGKFLTTDGSSASWSDKPLVNNAIGTQEISVGGVHNGYYKNDYEKATAAGTSSEAFYEGVAVGYNSKARGRAGIAIGTNSYTGSNWIGYGVAIGYNSVADVNPSVAIGYNSKSYSSANTVIGNNITCNGMRSIVLYVSTDTSNSVIIPNTVRDKFIVGFQGNYYEMLDGTDGTIPEARLADTTNAAAGQVLTLDSNLNAVWTTPSGGGASSATATLAVNDWSSNTQIVNVTGVTASNNVIVAAAPASQADYTSAGILCTAQGAGTLTFTCTTTPSSAITVNVLII